MFNIGVVYRIINNNVVVLIPCLKKIKKYKVEVLNKELFFMYDNRSEVEKGDLVLLKTCRLYSKFKSKKLVKIIRLK